MHQIEQKKERRKSNFIYFSYKNIISVGWMHKYAVCHVLVVDNNNNNRNKVKKNIKFSDLERNIGISM